MNNSATVADQSTQTVAEMKMVRDSVPGTPAPKMSILKINFEDLFQRHLCRHSEFGINILHLISVYGVYFSLLALVSTAMRMIIPNSSVLMQASMTLATTIPYLIVLAMNVPVFILMATIVSLFLLAIPAAFASFIPWPIHLILIVAWHRVQLVSHKRYTVAKDMTEFNQRYRKGAHLFALLAVYELPILLNYFLRGERAKAVGHTPK